MPELPEVETVARFCKNLLPAKIHHIEIYQKKLRSDLDPSILHIKNCQIFDVFRRAKYMFWKIEIGYLVFHFGMSGILRLDQHQKKHDHVKIALDHSVLFYNDPRRFGMIFFVKDLESFIEAKRLGVEPLSSSFTPQSLYDSLNKLKIPIKTFLFKQDVIAGLGNIYINEALYLSKIHPSTICSTLSYSHCVMLHSSIIEILQLAIQDGGSTLNDYFTPDGQKGYFKNKHQVYKKLFCNRCDAGISTIKIQGRSTFFCPKCQENLPS